MGGEFGASDSGEDFFSCLVDTISADVLFFIFDVELFEEGAVGPDDTLGFVFFFFSEFDVIEADGEEVKGMGGVNFFHSDRDEASWGEG